MKNWFDREPHPSDSLIYWQDRSSFARGWGLSHTDAKTFDEYVDKIRAAWDLIHGNEELKAAFELLQAAQEHKIQGEAADDAAGEDL